MVNQRKPKNNKKENLKRLRQHASDIRAKKTRKKSTSNRGEGASTSNDIKIELETKSGVSNENVGETGNQEQLATSNVVSQEDAELMQLETAIKKEAENMPELPDDEEYNIVISEPQYHVVQVTETTTAMDPLRSFSVQVDYTPAGDNNLIMDNSIKDDDDNNLIIDEGKTEKEPSDDEDSEEDDPNIDYKKEYKTLKRKTTEQADKIKNLMSKNAQLNSQNRSLKRKLAATRKELDALKHRYLYEKSRTSKYNIRNSYDVTLYNNTQ